MFACPVDGTLLLPEEVLGLRSVSFNTTDSTTIHEILRDAPDLMPGMRIGEYEIYSTLGEGGMGTVYAATHKPMNKKVAIKVIHRSLASDPLSIQRFRDEARAVSSVSHKCVVNVFDITRLPDGRPCLVMELLVGESLSARLKRSKLEINEKLQICIEVCEILEAAHAQNIVHRDLKPDNLFLVTDEGGQQHVKLLDFGIAKVLDGTDVQARTQTGVVIGTPAYMAPEQIRGGKFDARSDIYSLGVLFYRIFCGRPPFVNTSMVDLFMHHLQRQPPTPESLNGNVPMLLSPIMQQMLAKKPGNRPSLVRVRATLMAVQDPNSKIAQLVNTPGNGIPMPRSPLAIATALKAPLGMPVTQRTVALVIAGVLVFIAAVTAIALGTGDAKVEPAPAKVAWRLEPGAPDAAVVAVVDDPPPPTPDRPLVAVRIDPLNVRSRVCVGASCIAAQGSCILPAVADAPTKVSITAPGYVGYEATVKLASGERRELAVVLAPLKAKRPAHKPHR